MRSMEMGTKLVLYLSSLAIICLLFFQCVEQQSALNTSSYYLPDTTFVYVYQSTQASGIQYMKSSIQYDSILQIDYYDADLKRTQSRSELISAEGVRLQALKIVPNNDNTPSVQPINAHISYGDILPFESIDSTLVYVSRFDYLDPIDSARYEIIRNRRILGIESCPKDLWPCQTCLIVELKEEISMTSEGTWSTMFEGLVYYGKGVGLIYARKANHDGLQSSIVLIDQIEKKIWNKMNSEALN